MTRNGALNPKAVAALFEKYDMTVLGPPLSGD